tara:strand:+ start:262 stop:516 length:255 start_codon:yes stop_codon:yes gene_type:complete
MKKQEVLEKYKAVKLKFNSYYKFSFAFEGKSDDGCTVLASIGGDSDDIYRLDIYASKEETLSTLDPNYIKVTKGNDTLFEWDDY